MVDHASKVVVRVRPLSSQVWLNETYLLGSWLAGCLLVEIRMRTANCLKSWSRTMPQNWIALVILTLHLGDLTGDHWWTWSHCADGLLRRALDFQGCDKDQKTQCTFPLTHLNSPVFSKTSYKIGDRRCRPIVFFGEPKNDSGTKSETSCSAIWDAFCSGFLQLHNSLHGSSRHRYMKLLTHASCSP